MGDVLKSISDDLNEHERFLKESGLKKTGADLSNIGAYNARGRFARDGFRHGFKGKTLLAYIGKEVEKSELVKQIDELDRRFAQFAAIDSGVEDMISRASYDRK